MWTLSEILVTGPAAPELQTINNLAGQEIYARQSSSYYQSLLELSALNDFLTTHRQGTLQGNMLINRWYRDFDWAANALAASDYQRFNENVGIPDISEAEDNIHAGVKYLDWIRKRYFNDPEIDPYDQTLFAFAAYNAGPARVRKLREEAAKQGYDPNIWFDNVELVAACVIGRETGQYVANIVKYYVAYRLAGLLERAEQIQHRCNSRDKRKHLK